ncbi:NAD(P)-dependent oxidoreductase [Ciceribacter sp. L1K22]|uniref:NAD-dependent epimerase/dehydratase family protein n=1 Tax=Ciceribacter sp. L1K22 TaxID=2820275 RepID=UPI001ABDAF08|nr:NAD(P)-dependent oxidoreductase [Ciceribacter sp. L1K22]MBO3761917.1 NAD(P)-dependent oxidoreductase [Ciceribacter sp. L1K22]
MKVLVTGGTGLVGRYVVKGLLDAGYQVVVAGRHAPGEGCFSRPVGFVEYDLDRDADQSHIFDHAYYVVHAAFDHLAGRYRGGEGDDPLGFNRRNFENSVRLFEGARRAGVRRCVFFSSRAVYDGIDSGSPLAESVRLSPASLYGQVKLSAERALAELAAPGFVGASLRVTGVYGHMRPNKWDGIIDRYLAGETVSSRAGSEVHGQDVALAVRLMLESDAGKVSRQSFNVSDIVTDTHEILSVVSQVVGCPHPLPAPSDLSLVAEMETVRLRSLGWRPGGRALLEKTVRTLVG